MTANAPPAPVAFARPPKRSPRKPSKSTRDTLKRLKDLLQSRVAQIGELGAEITALANERDIRATNILVRTLEKVLELEHKERKQRSQRARQNRKLNDAERDELTRRIENLRVEHRDAAEKRAAEDLERANQGMDELGEEGSTSA
jgi:replication fork clamp-binding protein CrfC